MWRGHIAETPRTNWWGVYAGVIVAAGVSLAVASALLGFGKLKEDDPEGLPDADVGQRAAASVASSVSAPVGQTVSASTATSTTATPAILAALAQVLLEPDKADALRNAESFEDVTRMLAADEDDS